MDYTGKPKPIVLSLLEPVTPQTGGVNDLGDEAVVTLLVRSYVDRCLDSFHDALTGARTQDDASEDIYAVAMALNDLLLGLEPFDGVTLHPWNDPDQLGVFLRDTLDLDFPPDECVRAALVLLATHIMDILRKPEEERGPEIEALIVETRDLLLGRLADEGGDNPFTLI